MINSVSNVNFTGRCPSIKQGQWAVHCIDAYIPHQSAFKYGRHFDSFCELYKVNRGINPKTPARYPQKVLNFIPKNFSLNDRIIGMSEEYLSHVNGTFERVMAPIKQMMETHLGACYENACAAETVLRANGVKNPVTACLSYDNNTTRHVVCLFNRDGSKVDRVVNNKTIVVDPLFGIVDFAGNAEKVYRRLFPNCIESNAEKLNLTSVAERVMTTADIENFKMRFPHFIQQKKA